MTIKYSKI